MGFRDFPHADKITVVAGGGSGICLAYAQPAKKRSPHPEAVKFKEFGDVLDAYILGAGVFETAWSNFWDDTEEDRYAEVDINVNHPIKLYRIAICAWLRKNKKGVIPAIAFLAGFAGTLSAPLYTKHAVVGFVCSMAVLDEREGIKVLGITPR
ncbi:hypothetical protein B2J93_2039 [Marssonina coronariae]|uniref:Uncharacterized protein n=1 Tax=Diplocarpon coronariae TaxID=2795749 RepID=A0A218ZJ64_9HELO|nr:hypothetical protein B2J93_2039 [Marssonina coronariae]